MVSALSSSATCLRSAGLCCRKSLGLLIPWSILPPNCGPLTRSGHDKHPQKQPRQTPVAAGTFANQSLDSFRTSGNRKDIRSDHTRLRARDGALGIYSSRLGGVTATGGFSSPSELQSRGSTAERTGAAAFRNEAAGGATSPSSQHGRSNSPCGGSRADRRRFSPAIFPWRRRDLNRRRGAGGRSRVISDLTDGSEDLYVREVL